jgi:hypothetical protein
MLVEGGEHVVGEATIAESLIDRRIEGLSYDSRHPRQLARLRSFDPVDRRKRSLEPRTFCAWTARWFGDTVGHGDRPTGANKLGSNQRRTLDLKEASMKRRSAQRLPELTPSHVAPLNIGLRVGVRSDRSLQTRCFEREPIGNRQCKTRTP